MARAFHNIHIQTLSDGRAEVRHHTNDDDDDGYDDGKDTLWMETCPTVQQALDRHGVSHTGLSGIRVSVWLDGKKLEEPNA